LAFPEIVNNTICNNQASGPYGGLGGGIFCDSFSSPRISNNVIYQNQADQGGAVYCGGYGEVMPGIVGNTMTGNRAADGAGIYSDSASPSISNNIIAFNDSGVCGNVDMWNNCVYGNSGYDYKDASPGVDDISIDPRLVSVPTANFHLSAGSPCINAGYNSSYGLATEDVDGEPRIRGGAVDIGVDEAIVTSVPIASIIGAKSASDNSWLDIRGAVISAVFATPDDRDAFYIETLTRVSGIRVQKPGHNLSQGAITNVEGVIRTNANGERYIHPCAIGGSGTGNIDPIGMANRAVGGGACGLQADVIGGFGLNNIGLLVKTWGTVTYAEYNFFYLDDGSKAWDGSGYAGVKVYGTVPVAYGEEAVGRFVSVVGASSCGKTATGLARVIRTRSDGDVFVLR
jgi:hypothetical protein